ncbi:MAG: aminotransferase class V-fold PLP-dependent enzyme [Pseudomonadota bacterium]
MSLDVAEIRQQFPILSRQVNGQPLVYLDNAATTQKPQAVIDALVDYYSQCNANVHRGAHYLSDEATKRFEAARCTVADYINAQRSEEVIWTSGTTESINMVANGAAQRLTPNDEVLVTEMEHHADLVTWQQACKRSGASLKVVPIHDNGELNIEAFHEMLSEQTAVVAMPHVSNALGTINPVKQLTEAAKAKGALVLIDGAQGVAHGAIDVQDIGCDFYAFSGHKLFGPTGIGVLWGRYDVLADWPVWLVGGEMIAHVTYQDASWGELPNRLEAGTPNIAGAIGLAAAIEWLQGYDRADIWAHEQALLTRATELAEQTEGFNIVGSAANKIGVLSFVIDGTHPADIGFILDKQGIAIRTGDHCAQPLMRRLKVPGTARASFTIYNSTEDVDALFKAINKARKMLA